MNKWLKYALMRSVMQRSVRVALIVGTLIGLINYGDKILAGSMQSAEWIKAVVTYAVPYIVSTYAAVSTILHMERQKPAA